MDGNSLYGNIQPRLHDAAVFFIRLQESRLYRNNLPQRYFFGKVFKAGFPYAAEPVIIIRFCDAMTGTPADDTHAIRAGGSGSP